MILAVLTEIGRAGERFVRAGGKWEPARARSGRHGKKNPEKSEKASEKSRQRYHPLSRTVNALSRGRKKKHKCPEFAEIPGMEIERGEAFPLLPMGNQK